LGCALAATDPELLSADAVRFALDFPTSGEFSDPRLLAELARHAEDAGWEGCFVWDHINMTAGEPLADAWMVLGAIAATTERMRLGPLVTPLYRRHPWKVARESVTLDHLSRGRLTLGVGLGSNAFDEVSTFMGPLDDRIRAEMLDESLAIITGLWSGARFSFRGKHYRVEPTQFLPTPFQSPRIPIWIAGAWPHKAPFRRAARYDGALPVAGNFRDSLTPASIAELVEFVGRLRPRDKGFDVAQFGTTSGDSEHDRQIVTSYALAGATWWVETIDPHKPLTEVRRRLRQGPPTVDCNAG
jgi:alkanesulfonate monooxygenase SsuD/methylene tetrahydromethanopterin reductase-like flavin-dependent oxidoreductase (luciferase family)